MLAFVRALSALAGRRAGLYGGHARARATHVALLAAFGAATLFFLSALATTALAAELGWIAAFAIMAGVSAVATGIVALLMRMEQRQHEAALRAQARDDERLMRSALVGALPTLRKGGLLGVAAGLAALLLLTGGSKGGDDRRG